MLNALSVNSYSQQDTACKGIKFLVLVFLGLNLTECCVTTAWCVLGFWWRKWPPDMEGNCRFIE